MPAIGNRVSSRRSQELRGSAFVLCWSITEAAFSGQPLQSLPPLSKSALSLFILFPCLSLFSPSLSPVLLPLLFFLLSLLPPQPFLAGPRGSHGVGSAGFLSGPSGFQQSGFLIDWKN